MTSTIIREAEPGDETAIAELMAQLWHDGVTEEFKREAACLIQTGIYGTLPGVIFLAINEDGGAAGFLQVGLRSHADGCDVSRPVGFIEGWFVRPESRGLGIGRALVSAAQQWSHKQGCMEMASDALLDSTESLRAHRAVGFEIVDLCAHFRKPI